ncbi:ABC transporter substrate-binding protein [Pigmentiphaga litoralis]|uniref:tripartite tricarboxylate transporter substrate binding protein n=1 Tax=Pigmentiphaga litoralis TaxID=516702 RepID=UPI001677945A|nr:tripartite tricarboxylate transporter substrate binding protein [Pigmentiphaga litoralis]GGX13821.1 ABC transporter substrate-binding protein [Pigmentiphaga litoralis]
MLTLKIPGLATLTGATALATLCTLAAWPAAVFAATAADWPTGMVRIIVPFPPGGTTDAVARLLAEDLAKSSGKSVIVENRPGANTQIGTDAVAKAAPDGLTLLFTTSPYAIIAAMYPKLPYDPAKDLVPVVRVAENAMLLVAHPGAPAKTVRDMVALAKDKPGALTIASVGNTGMSYMSSELFAASAGIQVTHVPYKGTGQAMPDLLGGQVSYFFDNPSTSLPYVRSGKLMAIASTGRKREAALSDVPTLAEGGLTGFETVNWYGIFAPARTPAEVLDRINRDVVRFVTRPDVKERLARDSVEVVGSSRPDFASFLQKDMAKWATVVKERNIRPE